MRPGIKGVILGTVVFAMVNLAVKIFFGEAANNDALLKTAISSVTAGFVMSFLFGYVAQIYVGKHDAALINLDDFRKENEKILFQTPANYFYSNGVDAGVLFLTNERIIFRSRNYVYGKTPKTILLHDVTKSPIQDTLSFLKDEVIFILPGNKKEKFAIRLRKEFLKKFEDAYRNITAP